MESFDEFLAKRGYIRGYNHDFQTAYDFGAQSRQGEIDCLKVQLDGANERAMMLLNHKNTMVEKRGREIDELKKRICDSIGYVNEVMPNDRQSIIGYQFWKLKNILEGNQS